MNDAAEQWKAVKGYEGSYEASTMGRIRSLDRIASDGKRIKGVVLRPATGVYGRKAVMLSKGAKACRFDVSLLVLSTFGGDKPEGKIAVNVDGDISNSRIDNLYWGTRKDVMDRQCRKGVRPCGSKHVLSILNEEQVIAIRAASGTITGIAKLFGVAVSTISGIRSGKEWAHVKAE